MTKAERGQISATAADVYEKFFVPALFAEPAAKIVTAAGINTGQSVLDVACGTGVVARHAAKSVGESGSVTGVDVNPNMLIVAEREAPELTWHEARAEKLPYEDAAFDAVLCQFGLMFFEDRVAAIREMNRVVKPGGMLAVSVWDALETSPGYAAMVALIERLFSEREANALRAPFALGDTRALADLFEKAGVTGALMSPLMVTARFPSLEDWVRTDIRGWTLAEMIDDAQYARLLEAAKSELAGFVTPNGTVAFPSPVHLVMARKA